MIAYRDVRGRWRSLAVVATTLLGVGCQGGDSPVAPASLRCPSAQVPLCMDAAQATAVRAAAADAQLRLIPALEGAPTRAVIGQRLTAVASRLDDGDVTGARIALSAARAALAESRAHLPSQPADAADLAAIELTLDQIAVVVGDS
jgi:hypothetical protein